MDLDMILDVALRIRGHFYEHGVRSAADDALVSLMCNHTYALCPEK